MHIFSSKLLSTTGEGCENTNQILFVAYVWSINFNLILNRELIFFMIDMYQAVENGGTISIISSKSTRKIGWTSFIWCSIEILKRFLNKFTIFRLFHFCIVIFLNNHTFISLIAFRLADFLIQSIKCNTSSSRSATLLQRYQQWQFNNFSRSIKLIVVRISSLRLLAGVEQQYKSTTGN